MTKHEHKIFSDAVAVGNLLLQGLIFSLIRSALCSALFPELSFLFVQYYHNCISMMATSMTIKAAIIARIMLGYQLELFENTLHAIIPACDDD